jgi:parvulin-like peptidyl-prolyl isomerase
VKKKIEIVKKFNVRNIVFVVLAFVLAATVTYIVWDSIANSKNTKKNEDQILIPSLKGPPGIVARIGKIDITLTEYADMIARERVRIMSEENKDISEPVNIELAKSVRDSVLNSLIQDAVYKNYAIENNLEPTDAQLTKAINEEVDSQATQVGGYEKLEKKYKENGFKSVDDYKAKLRIDKNFVGSMTTAAVKKHIQDNVKITEKDARDFYESKLIGISRIVVYFDSKLEGPEMTKEGYDSMLKLRDLIGKKGTFAEIARDFSQEYETAVNGGKVQDLFVKGVLPESVDKVVWNLKVGEVSMPILTEDSYQLVKLDMETYVWQYYFADTKTNKKTPFEQVKNKVGDQLITIKTLEEENKWFNSYIESLKKEVFIEYKEVAAPKQEQEKEKTEKSK